jgi:hypothetical protein
VIIETLGIISRGFFVFYQQWDGSGSGEKCLARLSNITSQTLSIAPGTDDHLSEINLKKIINKFV